MTQGGWSLLVAALLLSSSVLALRRLQLKLRRGEAGDRQRHLVQADSESSEVLVSWSPWSKDAPNISGVQILRPALSWTMRPAVRCGLLVLFQVLPCFVCSNLEDMPSTTSTTTTAPSSASQALMTTHYEICGCSPVSDSECATSYIASYNVHERKNRAHSMTPTAPMRRWRRSL